MTGNDRSAMGSTISGMKQLTKELWERQDQHRGDRLRLFTAVGQTVDAHTVLYPGSFVDVAPSFVFPAVTYLDEDSRAARFFADAEGVEQIVGEHRTDRTGTEVRFLHGDYGTDVGIAPHSFDLLVSLYAGFVSEYCTHYLRIGGTLLVNPSHGDAAMAAIDTRYALSGVIESRSGDYRVGRSNLNSYLVPKKEQSVTPDLLHRTGRGVGYTKSPFAYLFTRIA